ncbi:MAG: hypothetical protein K6B68_14450 [Eubacterium sp.]|nr:hypothetical protein [Eubacterium sp.]
MNVTKCVNGHYYDSDRFGQCPHCNEQINNNEPAVRIKLPNMNVGVGKTPITRQGTEDVGETIPYLDMDFAETMLKMQDSNNAPAMTRTYKQEEQPQAAERLIMGWLVGIEGEDRGKFYPIYNEINYIAGVCVVFNEKLYRIFIDLPGSSTSVDLNSRKLVENEYIYHHDKVRFKGNTYLVVEVCREGFTWKKEEKQDSRYNSEILKSLWNCKVCGAMNEENKIYCPVCGAMKN